MTSFPSSSLLMNLFGHSKRGLIFSGVFAQRQHRHTLSRHNRGLLGRLEMAEVRGRVSMPENGLRFSATVRYSFDNLPAFRFHEMRKSLAL